MGIYYDSNPIFHNPDSILHLCRHRQITVSDILQSEQTIPFSGGFGVRWFPDDAEFIGNDSWKVVSAYLGANQTIGTLTWFGRLIANFLDLIDANHCRKAYINELK